MDGKALPVMFTLLPNKHEEIYYAKLFRSLFDFEPTLNPENTVVDFEIVTTTIKNRYQKVTF